jgi:nitroreductase
MDVIELIKSRRSIRSFTQEIPPDEIIVECLEAAAWAPNQSNQQPWKFIVLEGTKLAEVITAIEENFAAAFQKRAESPAPHMTKETAAMLLERKQETYLNIEDFFDDAGIEMQTVVLGNYRFHDAPMAVLFATYGSQDNGYYASTVSAMENFILAATAKGLGTCQMSAVFLCQEYIINALDLPSELILVGGLAVGYAEENAPPNLLPRTRLPLEEVTAWFRDKATE